MTNLRKMSQKDAEALSLALFYGLQSADRIWHLNLSYSGLGFGWNTELRERFGFFLKNAANLQELILDGDPDKGIADEIYRALEDPLTLPNLRMISVAQLCNAQHIMEALSFRGNAPQVLCLPVSDGKLRSIASITRLLYDPEKPVPNCCLCKENAEYFKRTDLSG